MKSTQEKWLHALLYRALGEPIGLLLQSDDPVRARQKLYQAKYSAKDTALAGLAIKMSTIEGGQLMIYHQSALDALAPAPSAGLRPTTLFDNSDISDLIAGDDS